ncbi:hypothetical protein OAS39_11650 [Pirellulales bacterium]|nr:hypothetical protein [Pirellulales bacterium]
MQFAFEWPNTPPEVALEIARRVRDEQLVTDFIEKSTRGEFDQITLEEIDAMNRSREDYQDGSLTDRQRMQRNAEAVLTQLTSEQVEPGWLIDQLTSPSETTASASAESVREAERLRRRNEQLEREAAELRRIVQQINNEVEAVAVGQPVQYPATHVVPPAAESEVTTAAATAATNELLRQAIANQSTYNQSRTLNYTHIPEVAAPAPTVVASGGAATQTVVYGGGDHVVTSPRRAVVRAAAPVRAGVVVGDIVAPRPIVVAPVRRPIVAASVAVARAPVVVARPRVVRHRRAVTRRGVRN